MLPRIAGGIEDADNGQKRPSDPMETFCFMMIEDFLMRKGLEDTLSSFRSEWARPGESNMTFSWYEVCMKLRLHEILEKSPERETVLENLATTLTTEASLRMRAPRDVVVSGLAAMPTVKPVPGTLEHVQHLEEPVLGEEIVQQHLDRIGGESGSSKGRETQRGLNVDIGRLQEIARSFQQKGHRQDQIYNPNKGKPSSENWIPEIDRMKSLGRDLAVAEENLGDIIKREVQAEREMRQFKTTIFEKAKVEESLGSKKKIMCGCCMRYFSYVNLPLKVSNKAVVDLRKKWSNGARGWWSARDDKLGCMPRCYNDVSVCHFCSQFFMDQDGYRPSLEKLEYEERKKAHFATKRKEKEKWDPVRMLEKDREEWAKVLEAQEREEVTSEGGASVANSVQSGQSIS